MTLLHPLLFAAGLAAIAIPIAIHFFMRRRRQPIAWGAMRFLLEAYQQQRRRLEFEKWLLLALRCLVVALLALGLARPLLGGVGLGGDTPRELYVLIDNSLAASATGDDGVSALDRHKLAARAALSRLDPGRGDRAALITLATPADPLVAPPSAEPGAVADLVDTLTPTDAAPDLAGAFARVSELTTDAAGDTDRVVLVLTDWREPALDAADDLPPLDPAVRVITQSPAETRLDNQQITSVRPLRAVVLAGEAGSGVNAPDAAASAQQVRVELRRLGPSLPAAEGTLLLRLDRVRADGTIGSIGSAARAPTSTPTARGPVTSETPFTWTTGQTEATLVVPLPAINDPSPGLGVLTARLRAQPGLDAIAGDNAIRRVVDVRRSLRVGIIARARYGARVGVGSFTPADWLAAALDPELSALTRTGSPIEPVPVEPSAVDAPRLAGLDAVFILEPAALDQRAWNHIADFTRRGGLTILTPDAQPGAAAWTTTAVNALDLPIALDPEPRDHDPVLAVDAPDDGTLGPLALLAAELQDLTGPVRVFRTLGVRPAEATGTGQSNTDLTPLLTLSDGSPLVAVTAPQTTSRTGSSNTATSPGLVAIFTTAIDPAWTDLPARPLFVPLIHELVRQGVGEARGASAVPAGARLAAGPGAAEFAAIDPASAAPADRRLRVDAQGLSATPVRTAGAFAVLDADGAMRTLALVNPDTRAGRTAPTPQPTVTSRLAAAAIDPVFIDPGDAPLADRVATALRVDSGTGSPVAWIALLAALVLALAEIALARRASHAELDTAGAQTPRSAPATNATSKPTNTRPARPGAAA